MDVRTIEGDDGMLTGMNVLGLLLVELRREGPLVTVPPPAISDFLLFGEPIRAIEVGGAKV